MAERSWTAAAAAAVAVLTVIGVGVALSSGSGPHNDDAAGTTPDNASGGGTSGDAGTARPSVQPLDPPSGTAPHRPRPSGVAPRHQPPFAPDRPLALSIQSYEVLAPGRLQIRYATGVPECYGRLDHAAVAESEDRVVITVLLAPATAPASRPCPEIALVEDTVVELTAPLGDRAVVDGSTRRIVRRGHDTP